MRFLTEMLVHAQMVHSFASNCTSDACFITLFNLKLQSHVALVAACKATNLIIIQKLEKKCFIIHARGHLPEEFQCVMQIF